MDLTEARRLEAAATQAPWIRPWNALFIHARGRDDVLSKQENLDLAVHLRNHATDYFDAVEQRDQLREVLERLLGALDGSTHGLFEEWPATQGAVQAEGILIADLEPDIYNAREALRRLQGEAAR